MSANHNWHIVASTLSPRHCISTVPAQRSLMLQWLGVGPCRRRFATQSRAPGPVTLSRLLAMVTSRAKTPSFLSALPRVAILSAEISIVVVVVAVVFDGSGLNPARPDLGHSFRS